MVNLKHFGTAMSGTAMSGTAISKFHEEQNECVPHHHIC